MHMPNGAASSVAGSLFRAVGIAAGTVVIRACAGRPARLVGDPIWVPGERRQPTGQV
jgi:hypothetical protein